MSLPDTFRVPVYAADFKAFNAMLLRQQETGNTPPFIVSFLGHNGSCSRCEQTRLRVETETMLLAGGRLDLDMMGATVPGRLLADLDGQHFELFGVDLSPWNVTVVCDHLVTLKIPDIFRALLMPIVNEVTILDQEAYEQAITQITLDTADSHEFPGQITLDDVSRSHLMARGFDPDDNIVLAELATEGESKYNPVAWQPGGPEETEPTWSVAIKVRDEFQWSDSHPIRLEQNQVDFRYDTEFPSIRGQDILTEAGDRLRVTALETDQMGQEVFRVELDARYDPPVVHNRRIVGDPIGPWSRPVPRKDFDAYVTFTSPNPFRFTPGGLPFGGATATLVDGEPLTAVVSDWNLYMNPWTGKSYWEIQVYFAQNEEGDRHGPSVTVNCPHEPGQVLHEGDRITWDTVTIIGYAVNS